MTIDLDVIRQAIEERDAALQKVDDLAELMIYNGNSVSWWHSKAERYQRDLELCWIALRESGIDPDGETMVSEGIRKLAIQKQKG